MTTTNDHLESDDEHLPSPEQDTSMTVNNDDFTTKPAAPRAHEIPAVNESFIRAQQALINRLEELSLVEDIARQLSGALGFEEIVNNMLEIALRITVADRATLATITESGSSWLVTGRRSGENAAHKSYRTRGRDDGIFGEVLRNRAPVRIDDSHHDHKKAYDMSEGRSILAVPLIDTEAVIGILTVESVQPTYFRDDEQNFLVHLAGHTVIAIENNRLIEEHRHRIEMLSSLQYLTMRTSKAIGLADVEFAIRETACQMLAARDAAIFHYNAAADELKPTTSVQTSLNQLFPSHESLRAARTGEIQITHHTLPISVPLDIKHDDMPPLTFISIPIRGEHSLNAVLVVSFNEHRRLRKRDLDALELLAVQAGSSMEKAQLQEQIRLDHDRMSAILQSTRDGVLLLDREGKLVEINPSAERLLGIQRDDMINRNFVSMIFQFMDEGKSQGIGYSRSQLIELARQLRTQPSRITKREFMRVTDTKTIYIEEIGSPVMDEHHTIVGRLLVLRDVTEQKQLEEYRQDIVNMTIHDLRGPLASIMIGLDVALSDLREPNLEARRIDLQKLLSISTDSAAKLIELVDSVMEIANLESRELPLNPTIVSPIWLAQSAFEALRSGFEAADITIKVDVPDDLRSLFIDERLIRRMLINLLDNALRYTPTGGTVILSAKPSLRRVDRMIFSVADSGNGIAVSEHKAIFGYFRQVKNNLPVRGSRGSGLGLTFCRLAIEAHGGEIWVEKESPLSGACIAFALPFAPAA